MQWVGTNRSAVQSMDIQGAAPTLSVDGTMALTFATDHLISTVRAGGQNVTLNLYDSSKYILQTDLTPITQSLSRLKGTDTSVVLGAPNTNANYETIIGGKTSSRTFMCWPVNNLSAIQSIDQSTTVTSLTLPNSTMVQGYTVNGSVGTLVTKFQDSTGTAYTLNLQDAAQFATAANFTTLNSTMQNHTTTLASLSTSTSNISGLVTTVNGNTTDITALTATVSGHTTQLTKLNGTGTSVVLGAPAVDTAYETIIGGKTSSRTFMSWPVNKLSAIQSIEQYTALTSLTLPNSTMVQGYTVNGSVGTLVTKFRTTAGTEYILNLQDAAQFATAANFTTLNTTVQNHTTTLATLSASGTTTSTELTVTVAGHTIELTKLDGSGTSVALGAAAMDATYDAIISGTSTNLSRILVKWKPNLLSAIQTIDTLAKISSETLTTGNLMLGYDSTTLPTLVARFNDGTSTRTLNLRDASVFGSADAVTSLQTLTGNQTTQITTLNTTVAGHTTQFTTLNTTVTGQTTQLTSLQTKVTKLDGTVTSAVLGSAPVDATCDAIISGTSTNSSRVLMKWLTGSKSAIQSVDDATTLTTLTLPANNLAFGYTTTPLPTLVSMFSDASGTKQTLYHSMYRPMLDLTNISTSSNVCNLTTACANRFCVYAVSTGITSAQSINLCYGFEAGTEIEIFNNSANTLAIVPFAANTTTAPFYAAADLFSVSQNRNINAYGAAVIKVYKKGDAVIKPTFFLIGSLS